MANINRKPVSLRPVPKCIRSLALLPTEFKRRLAAKHLPWSRLNPAQQAIALRVIVEGKAAYA